MNHSAARLISFALMLLIVLCGYVFGSIILSACVSGLIFLVSFRYEGRRGQVDLLSPFMLFAWIYLLGFFLRPIMLEVLVNGFYRPDWNISTSEYVRLSLKALFFSHIGFLAFWFGYTQKCDVKNRVIAPSEYALSRVDLSLLIWIFTLLSCIAYSVYVFRTGLSFGGFLTNSVNLSKAGSYPLIAACWMISLSTGALFYKTLNSGKLAGWICFVPYLLMALMISSSFHDRKWPVYLFLTLAIFYNYLIARLTILQIMIAGGVMVSFLLVLLVIRNLLYSGDIVNLASLSGLLSSEIFIQQIILGGMVSFYDYFARTILFFESASFTPIHLVNYLIDSVIPSSLIGSDIKTLTVSQWLATHWGANSSARAPAISLFGEFYAYGGLIFVIFGLSLLGYFFRFVYLSLLGPRRGKLVRLLIYCLVSHSFILLTRSGFFPSIIGFLLFLVTFTYFYMVLIVVKKASVKKVACETQRLNS